MPGYIRRSAEGHAVVENPVNPLENFADKWRKYPQRARYFQEWVEKAIYDFQQLEIATMSTINGPLRQWFGDRVTKKILNDYGSKVQKQRLVGLAVSGATGLVGGVPGTASASPQHTFFGE